MKTNAGSVLALLALAGCVAPSPRMAAYPLRYSPPPGYQSVEVRRIMQPDPHSDLLAQEADRERAQHGRVVHMSNERCYGVVEKIPGAAAPLGPVWHPGEPSQPSPYLTPQENWCMALGRSQEAPADNTFPGFLPEGARATYLGDGRWQITR